MYTLDIDGKEYKVEKEVADLVISVSLERDELKGEGRMHEGDPCIHCKTPHDEVEIGDCPGSKEAKAKEATIQEIFEYVAGRWIETGIEGQEFASFLQERLGASTFG